MKIVHIGHACFLIEATEARIVTDPFAVEVPYQFPSVSADIVTVSHDHHDHNAADRVLGKPTAVRGVGTHRAAGLEVLGIASSHDASGGSQRGDNVIFAFTLEGLRLAHMGDLGTPLDAAQIAALRGVQVLFLPVGGTYTIDAAGAAGVVRQLPDVRVVFPMHYRTESVAEWPIAPVEDFLRTMDNVRHIESSGVVLTKSMLPETLEVWVLEPA